MSNRQKTIKEIAEYEGTGLFSGEKARLRFLPATAGTGIRFVRTDLPESPKIPVNVDNAVSRFRRTCMSNGDVIVETIEHLMGAIGGLGIDNLEIEINGPEVPSGDGSAKHFVDVLREAEVVEQDQEREEIELRESVSVRNGDASITVHPREGAPEYSFSLNYDHPRIGAQHFTFSWDADQFAEEIAPARTFVLESEVDHFLDQGLGQGASYDNTLVVGEEGVIENELRFPDEFVRHKILDLMGDLSIIGGLLPAHHVAVRSGHETNLKLARSIQRSLRGEEHFDPESTGQTMLDMQDILDVLPHRYPFLLIDRVIELDGYDRAVGIKNVTFNEPYFQGHFPDKPIMPGVLQIEAMAQLSGALLLRKAENVDRLAFLMSMDNVKLRKTVTPGDQLRIEAEALKVKTRTALIEAKATVQNQMAAEARLKFMLIPQE